MRKKKTVFLLLALLLAIPLAARERDCLLVHFASGSYVVFPLTSMPQITFDDGVMQIASDRYQVSDVRRYTFGDSENTGISDVTADSGVSSFSRDGRFIRIALKDPSQPLRLYSLSGVELVNGLKPDADGVVTIDMSRLGADGCLLSIGGETIKIRRL